MNSGRVPLEPSERLQECTEGNPGALPQGVPGRFPERVLARFPEGIAVGVSQEVFERIAIKLLGRTPYKKFRKNPRGNSEAILKRILERMLERIP